METVLAIDLGGTSLRAGLVSPQGETLALATHPHRIAEEANPADWWRALGPLLAELPAQAPSAEVAGIGLSGFTRTQIFVDAAGTPLRPAICFADGRATAEAEALEQAAAGGWTAMTPYHPLARLAWVRAHEPGIMARTIHVLQPKDWLAMQFTGRAVCDHIANAWAMERRAPVRSLALFRRADFDPTLLPDVLNPWDRVGRATTLPPGAPPALAGAPVFVGGMDTWCASVGAGARQAGDAYLVSGTTDAGGVLTDAPQTAPGLVTLPWGQGLYHIGGPSSAGADCLEWMAAILGMPDAAAVSALAEAADPAAPPLLFLPALTGERAPTWEPGARGGFLGLHRRHGPPELARAVLEGVAFADRDVLEGAGFTRLLITGGGARSDQWCQTRADVLGRPVLRAAAAEPGVVGAALAAWTGLGRFPTLSDAQAVLQASAAAWQPNPAAQARQQRIYDLYKRFQAASLDLAQDLARA